MVGIIASLSPIGQFCLMFFLILVVQTVLKNPVAIVGFLVESIPRHWRQGVEISALASLRLANGLTGSLSLAKVASLNF